MNNQTNFGLIAEFDNAEDLLKAAEQAREAGYQDMRAYTPIHVEGLADILKQKVNSMQWVVLGGLLLGAFIGFWLQYYTDVLDYPLNIGGRPFNSWQAFLLITFELGVLFAGLGVAAAILIPSNLPLPYHPVFNAPNIELASRSNFFLCILVSDKQFDNDDTRSFLEGLQPKSVSEVPN